MINIYRYPLLLLLGLVALLATACLGAPLPPTLPPGGNTPEPGNTPGPGTTPPPAPQDAAGLVAALTAAGLVVTPAGPIQQPFLTPAGTAYNVDHGLVQIFVYPDAAAAERDVAKIAPDGHIQGYFVQWVDQPHFYRNGAMVVIYVGSDPAVLAALEALLGPPFAVGEKPTGPPMPLLPTAVP